MPQFDWNPGKLMQLSGAYWQTCALHAAVKLDLFTHLAAQPQSAAQLAAIIDADKDATARLLNAMCAMDLAEKTESIYTARPAAARFLAKTSDGYIGFMIMHHHHLVHSWANLDQAVLSGRSVRDSVVYDDDKRESFLMGMHATARVTAPLIVPAIDLSACSHVLDLGGGPGTYAINFCQQAPDLTASVFDLPESRPFAEKNIAAHQLDGRIKFIGGNYRETDIPGAYDFVWMSHILHGESPAMAASLVKKAARALRPGGKLAIHEFILSDTADSPLFPALFSLNMLLGTDGGRAYTDSRLRDMMTAAGIGAIERLAVSTPNDSGVLIGRLAD